MDFIMVNLTPEQYFYNFQIQKIKDILIKANFKCTGTFTNFFVFKNAKSEKIKVRKDGSLYYYMLVDNFIGIDKLIYRIKQIIVLLNSAYNNLLNTNKFYIYWPKNFEYNNSEILGYNCETNNISIHKCATILNRKLCEA